MYIIMTMHEFVFSMNIAGARAITIDKLLIHLWYYVWRPTRPSL